MFRFVVFLTALVLLPISFLFSQITSNWESLLNGQGDFGDRLNTVVTDVNNNIYAAGYTVNPNTDRDFLIIKYNAQAQVQWRKVFSAPGNGPDEAKKILLHPNGNIVVSGYGNNKSVGNDFWTMMLNSSGDTLWTRLYNSPATNLYDEPNGMTIDGLGNIIITGESDQDPTPFLNNDFLTVKYNSTGSLLWAVRFNATANNNDRSVAVTTDATNSIYITGRSFNGNDDDYVTIKYNADGVQQWLRAFNNGGTDRPVAIGTDNAGRVYVTGRSSNGTDDDYRTLQYNSTGSLLFNSFYDFVGQDRPVDMVVLPAGGCIVTGRSDANPTVGINYDIHTVALSATGVRSWVGTYAGAAANDDIPVSIALAADGNVSVAGFTDRDNTIAISNDLVLLQYSSTGTNLITQTFNGTANKDDEGDGVTISSNGNIVVAGFTSEANAQRNALLLVYNGNNNAIAQNIWSGAGDNGENIRQLTTDANGNVFFCGYSVRQDNNRDFYFGKLNSSGALDWSRDTTGSLFGSDEEANAIALDVSGNVIVSGYLKNSGTSSDIYVEKFSNTGSRIWNYRYDSPINESDRSADMVLDNSGNIYLCGKTDVDPSWQVNDDILILKISSTGTILWTAAYSATSLLDKAQFVRLNSTGEVIVAGVLQNGTNDNVIVIKYNNAGVLQWTRILDFKGGIDKLNDMLLDNAGNIYLTGQSQLSSGSSDYDAFICKVTNAGLQEWVKFIGITGNGSDEGISLALASDNTLWVAGHQDSDAGINTNLDVFLMSYDASGNNLLTNPVLYQTPNSDEADDIVLMNNNEPCLAIHTNTATGGDIDYALRLLLLNNNTLTQAYQRNISDTIDVANLLLWNSSLNALFVGGSSWTFSGQRDALIGRYSQVPTALNEFSTLQVSAFPNPVSNYLILNDLPDSDVMLHVWDQGGRLIHQEKLTRGLQTKYINCSAWIPGTYIIRLVNHKAATTIQLIKK
jgi:uncharacterized delta-60 repeat protein